MNKMKQVLDTDTHNDGLSPHTSDTGQDILDTKPTEDVYPSYFKYVSPDI